MSEVVGAASLSLVPTVEEELAGGSPGTDSELSTAEEVPGVTGAVGVTGGGCTLGSGPVVGFTGGCGVTGATVVVGVVLDGDVLSELDDSVPGVLFESLWGAEQDEQKSATGRSTRGFTGNERMMGGL